MNYQFPIFGKISAYGERERERERKKKEKIFPLEELSSARGKNWKNHWLLLCPLQWSR